MLKERQFTASSDKRARTFRRIAGTVSIAILFGSYTAAGLYGQNANGNAPRYADARFDVASIRESPANSRSKNVGMMLGQSVFHGTLFSVNDYLGDYVQFAYKIDPLFVQWNPSLRPIQDKQFNIEARTATEPTTDELRQMVKSLLIERFKMKTHLVDSKKEVYFLSFQKPGVSGRGLVRHPSENDCSKQSSTSSGAHKQDACGMSFAPDATGLIHVKMVGVTLQQLADKLPYIGIYSGNSALPILDRTGLQGLYDIKFEYGLQPPPGSTIVPVGENAFDALKHQLGLKLVRGTATLPMLTVDSCEAPSAN